MRAKSHNISSHPGSAAKLRHGCSCEVDMLQVFRVLSPLRDWTCALVLALSMLCNNCMPAHRPSERNIQPGGEITYLQNSKNNSLPISSYARWPFQLHRSILLHHLDASAQSTDLWGHQWMRWSRKTQSDLSLSDESNAYSNEDATDRTINFRR